VCPYPFFTKPDYVEGKFSNILTEPDDQREKCAESDSDESLLTIDAEFGLAPINEEKYHL